MGSALLVSCASAEPEPETPKASRAEPVTFNFGTTEGNLLNSANTRGRSTALLFAATFDMASQVQAKHLDEVIRRHKPRANAGVVILEAPKYAVLAETFRTTLGLSYPVALADRDTLAGEGPFGRILGVPTLVVLDREGRPVLKHLGLMGPEQMEQALSAADRGETLPEGEAQVTMSPP